jgi:L-ascorbate metabolism protein UlaG (beta-lactamase superfamily)
MELVIDIVVAISLGVAGLIVLFIATGWWLSTPGYRGPVNDHFNGKRFRNVTTTGHAEAKELVRWITTRLPVPWGEPRDVAPGPPPPERVPEGRLRLTMVNHTTVLVQTQGVNILTDPIWSERCSPFPRLGPRRIRPPGVRFEDLPPIDVVLLSHNHYDHCDLPTLRRLAREHSPRVIVPLGCRRFLERKGIPVAAELDWWEEFGINTDVGLTAVPARHFSGRGLFDRDRSLWAAYMISTPTGNVFFAGDSGFGDHFQAIRDRLGAPRAALLPIGAYRPEWFMSRVHMSPDESIRAHGILGSGFSIATHFGTFRLADDGETEAAERIEAAGRNRPSGAAPFCVPDFGAGIDVD